MSSPLEPAADVTVLGAGLMGRALARTFADSGLRVIVWNRTHERAVALAGDRVQPVRSVEAAVASSPLVVACLSTYDSVVEALDGVSTHGTCLVNLTTGTPQEAARMSSLAADRGMDYLDGALLAFPDFIGAEDALVVYSGSPRMWDDFGDRLRCLGGQTQWIGPEVGSANVLDGALIISFYTTAVSSYVEAATYALDRGIPEDLLRSATRLVLRTIGHSTKEATDAISRREYATEQATLGTYTIGARSVLDSMHEDGVPARLLAATVSALEAACEHQLGGQGLYAQALVTRAAE